LAGSLMGTPGYMALEQLQGRPADARSDLFAFCASLHEALYGQLPFSGDTLGELARAQQEERVTPAPPSSEVPAWVARVVRQGLRADPSQRPASMEVLLAALEDDPEVKRRARLRTAAVSALVVGLAGLALWGLVRPGAQARGCEQVSRQLAGIWDARVKDRVRESLLGTGLPYARDTFARVASVLDGYARSWVAQRTEVCEAVRQQPAPVSGLAVRRESCLERRRSQLHALTELLSRGPDRELLPKAVQAVRSLPPLADCADDRALAAAVPLPEEPAVRARVVALQEALDRPEALLEAGKYPEAQTRADELLREAEQVGYAPLHARALFLVGRSRERTGDYPGAEQVMRQAIVMASRGKEPVLTARLWGLLFFQVGYFQARYPEAAAMELAMESAVEMADDDEVRAQVLNNQAVVLSMQGRAEEALRKYKQALGLREKVHGPVHPMVASVLNNLGNALEERGRYEEARRVHERALSIREEVLGPSHPDLAYTLGNLGNTLVSLGRLEEARRMHERALALREETLGPEHPLVASSLENLGDTLMKLERHEEARALFARAVALHEKSRGAEHPRTLGALSSLASALVKLARNEEASDILGRTLPLLEAALGPDHVGLSAPLHTLGEVLAAQGRYEKARKHYERALALQEKALGKEHPSLVDTLLQLGRLELARGSPARAVPPLERAHGLAEEALQAPVALALAQALWDAGQERARAVALATEARQLWERLGHPKAAEASRWLAAHASPASPPPPGTQPGASRQTRVEP
ncbi:MAG TPA: tetratricopeptide repeat-containing protein kinase family protein, partial [Myxococcaceae bacterium]|nr:tetratricopeptide repeat-containing protein kinase family protein [Myxococcaceae bacterium]